MKKILAVATMMTLLGSVVLAQNTGGDKKKTATESKAVQKTEPKTIAAPQANPFPTKKPAEKTALNPQPLPPGKKASTSTESKVALNPQPLPPGAKKTSASPESKVALNPQPLPPGAKKGTASPEGKVALNPQPLPPKAQTASQKKGTTAKSGKKSSSSGSGSSTPK
ncbi:MAG TPA: hypothetical protein VF532_14965 [Candidatus Angelobacter sp.]